MLRRFLLGIVVVSLASLAWAGVPDLEVSSATIDPAANGASIWVLPNGTGAGFDEAFAGGSVVDATINVILIDTAGDPIFLYPFEDLWLETSGDGLVACPGGTVADASTDAAGETTFSNAPLAGGNSFGETTLVIVAGAPLSGGGLPITFNSPDINGDLTVNLSDIVPFTQTLGGAYDYSADYNNDGVINLSDIVRFTPGIGTSCN